VTCLPLPAPLNCATARSISTSFDKATASTPSAPCP
jgi:hypothetical protein